MPEFIDIAGITASSKAEAKEAAAEKQNWFMRAIKLLGDIFVPIIPAIVASGFLMGIMNSLDFMNSNGFLHINTHSSIYVFANLFSNIAYTFLQILIAFSVAKAFGANQYLGAVIGMIMIHPSLQMLILKQQRVYSRHRAYSSDCSRLTWSDIRDTSFRLSSPYGFWQ